MPHPGGIARSSEQRQACCPLPAAAAGGTQDFLGVASDGRDDIREEDGDEVRDCVIVGAGIAGLAAAADLERAGLNFVLLEAGMRPLACRQTSNLLTPDTLDYPLHERS